jgi:membrane protease YdiL (CAAX protease family)
VQPGRALLSATGIVLLFLLVQATAFIVLDRLGVGLDIGDGIDLRLALALTLVQVAGIGAVVAMVTFGSTTWRDLGMRDTPPDSFNRGWRLLMPVGLLVIAPTLGYALASADEPVVGDGIGLPLALAFVLLSIAIAVNEELWFRGLVVDRLERGARDLLVIGGSALLFGLPHLSGTRASILNAVAVTFAVGIPFTIVRMRARSLWPLIAWHALIDTWAFIHTGSVVAEGSPSLGDALISLLLPVLVAVGYVTWFMRSRDRPATDPRR